MSEKDYEIVETAADCTIKQFMRAAFDGKYNQLVISGNPTDEKLKNAFEYIYAQYVDISGLYQSQEFEIIAYIQSLDHRITIMKRFVELQVLFMSHFKAPYVPGLKIADKYGHKLYWNPEYPDLDIFRKKLDQIISRESKYSIKVSEKVNELIALRKKKVEKEHSILESRKDFITMLNRLQKTNFIIDKNVMNMEELALLIKDTREQAEESRLQNSYKKR